MQPSFQPTHGTLIYDGACPICRASVQRLQARVPPHALAFLPFQSSRVLRDFPSLDPEALEESIHLVGPGGEVSEGLDALEAVLALAPPFSWVRFFLNIPLVRPLGRRVYRWVAGNRYALSCRDHCPDPEDWGENAPSAPPSADFRR